jgi:hypothetical protein
MDGKAVPGARGTATAINVQPTGDGKAAITGDFLALTSELNPLITALRGAGIEVTAIHNHMVGEEPRAFFIHFWANDDATRNRREFLFPVAKTATGRSMANRRGQRYSAPAESD